MCTQKCIDIWIPLKQTAHAYGLFQPLSQKVVSSFRFTPQIKNILRLAMFVEQSPCGGGGLKTNKKEGKNTITKFENSSLISIPAIHR